MFSAYGSELLPATVASVKKMDEKSPATVWTSKKLYICETGHTFLLNNYSIKNITNLYYF